LVVNTGHAPVLEHFKNDRRASGPFAQHLRQAERLKNTHSRMMLFVWDMHYKSLRQHIGLVQNRCCTPNVMHAQTKESRFLGVARSSAAEFSKYCADLRERTAVGMFSHAETFDSISASARNSTPPPLRFSRRRRRTGKASTHWSLGGFTPLKAGKVLQTVCVCFVARLPAKFGIVAGRSFIFHCFPRRPVVGRGRPRPLSERAPPAVIGRQHPPSSYHPQGGLIGR
jgi:hypothetical protein